jgi:hypothetical protein
MKVDSDTDSYEFIILAPDDNWFLFMYNLFDHLDTVVIVLLGSNNNVHTQAKAS